MAMKVQIRSIHGNGNWDDEYVILDVGEDCDIGHYMLADTTYLPSGRISNELRHLYWFPDKKVRSGDIVVLYTKSGINQTARTAERTPIHFFYWGLKVAVWNDAGDCATLIEAHTWQFKRAG